MMRRATEVAGIKRLRVGADKRGTRREVRGVRLLVAILALRPPRIRLEVQVLTPCPPRTRLQVPVLTPCPPLPSGEGGRTRLQVRAVRLSVAILALRPPRVRLEVPVLALRPSRYGSRFRSSPPVPLERASRLRSSPPVPLSTMWRGGTIGRHQPAPSLSLRTMSRPLSGERASRAGMRRLRGEMRPEHLADNLRLQADA